MIIPANPGFEVLIPHNPPSAGHSCIPIVAWVLKSDGIVNVGTDDPFVDYLNPITLDGQYGQVAIRCPDGQVYDGDNFFGTVGDWIASLPNNPMRGATLAEIRDKASRWGTRDGGDGQTPA
jgi:hypothetical protein